MRFWDERVLPRVIHVVCGSDHLLPLRERACADLHGRVLELGFGSGHNIGLYPDEVEEILVVEPSDRAWEMSAARRRDAGLPVTRVGLDGARLDLDDASVDSVLSTFTLCTIPDVDAALGECARVLRPGGRLHIAEHGLSPDPGVAHWQRRLDPWEQRLAGGCHLTRDMPALLANAGFHEQDLAAGYFHPVPKPWAWAWSGSAGN